MIIKMIGLFIVSLFIVDIYGLPEPMVKNLRARYDTGSNSIYIEWDFFEAQPTGYDVQFVVRYRVTNRVSPDSQWKLARTADRSVRLHLPDIRSGDELEVQVKVERGGQVIEDWSQQLLISVAKRLKLGEGILVEEGDLLPPLNFAANVMGPKTVKLEWRPYNPHIPGLYYIVNVKQLTTQSGTQFITKQIKIEATYFTLNDLVPGERYEMTIRSATPSDISSTAAIVEISLPKEDEWFEVGNLIISSHFQRDGRGIVNLTWEVPPEMIGKIKEYQVQYAPEGMNNFKELRFLGEEPSAALYDLQSDTEYVLKIKTYMTNNLETESGEFRFKTPKILMDPISKVDVLYSSSEANAVRLQWVLEPHIDLDSVAGYDVYISEDKSAPEDRWRYIRLDGKEASLSVNDIKASTTYYVRFTIRKTDGNLIQGPLIYHFRTIDQLSSKTAEMRQGNSLSYRNIAPGRVSISWTYPSSISGNIAGAVILYSDRKDQTFDQWRRITISDATTKSVVLQNLREGTKYYVHIIPKLSNGELDYQSKEKFELQTDARRQSQGFEHPYFNQARQNGVQFQEMRVSADTGEKHLNIVSCNPDAFKTGCAWDEHCIASVDNANVGWCIPDALRDSIIKSTSD
jgi:hypothetical protein